jgi:anti-anti-sigma regulatory factor
MAVSSVWLNIDGDRVAEALHGVGDKLEAVDGELTLDFSSVRRVDPGAIRAMEELASTAEEKAVKLVLRGVNVEVYKVLKLVRLDRRYAFA